MSFTKFAQTMIGMFQSKPLRSIRIGEQDFEIFKRNERFFLVLTCGPGVYLECEIHPSCEDHYINAASLEICELLRTSYAGAMYSSVKPEMLQQVFAQTVPEIFNEVERLEKLTEVKHGEEAKIPALTGPGQAEPAGLVGGDSAVAGDDPADRGGALPSV